MRAEGVHRDPLRLGVLPNLTGHFDPLGRHHAAEFVAQPLAELAPRVDDRRPPGRGAHRATGEARAWQRAIANLDPHTLQWRLERVRRDLGQRRPGAGADVRGGEEDAVVALRVNARDGG